MLVFWRSSKIQDEVLKWCISDHFYLPDIILFFACNLLGILLPKLFQTILHSWTKANWCHGDILWKRLCAILKEIWWLFIVAFLFVSIWLAQVKCIWWQCNSSVSILQMKGSKRLEGAQADSTLPPIQVWWSNIFKCNGPWIYISSIVLLCSCECF